MISLIKNCQTLKANKEKRYRNNIYQSWRVGRFCYKIQQIVLLLTNLFFRSSVYLCLTFQLYSEEIRLRLRLTFIMSKSVLIEGHIETRYKSFHGIEAILFLNRFRQFTAMKNSSNHTSPPLLQGNSRLHCTALFM